MFKFLSYLIMILISFFQNCLLAIMDHLSRVTAQSARNKMNPQNLSICFAPVLMLDFSQGQPVANNISEPIQILKYLIEIWPKSQGGLWTVKIWLLISMEHLIVKTWINETQLEIFLQVHHCPCIEASTLVNTTMWPIWMNLIGQHNHVINSNQIHWSTTTHFASILGPSILWQSYYLRPLWPSVDCFVDLTRPNTNLVFPLVLPVKKSVLLFLQEWRIIESESVAIPRSQEKTLRSGRVQAPNPESWIVKNDNAEI